MAQRGRKPKPTAVKVLEGNPGKRQLNPFEPQPGKRAPQCPEWLNEEAKKEFENQNGPMNHFSVNNNKTYKWLNDPWPWEYAKNKEV